MNNTHIGIINMNPSEIVGWCRQAKQSINYSNAKIAELTNVPLGTIDRIFSGNYTEFRYSSIQPIVSCLLQAIEDNTESSDPIDSAVGYKLILQAKEMEIRQLQKENDVLKLEKDFIKKENDTKLEHIKWLETIIDKLTT